MKCYQSGKYLITFVPQVTHFKLWDVDTVNYTNYELISSFDEYENMAVIMKKALDDATFVINVRIYLSITFITPEQTFKLFLSHVPFSQALLYNVDEIRKMTQIIKDNDEQLKRRAEAIIKAQLCISIYL